MGVLLECNDLEVLPVSRVAGISITDPAVEVHERISQSRPFTQSFPFNCVPTQPSSA